MTMVLECDWMDAKSYTGVDGNQNTPCMRLALP